VKPFAVPRFAKKPCGQSSWQRRGRSRRVRSRHRSVGFLSPLSAAAAAKNIAAFRSALRDLGYVEGRNMTLASRYGDRAIGHQFLALRLQIGQDLCGCFDVRSHVDAPL
jgi:hypothetical protein